MKKQLLILILAIFAVGFSSTAFGQNRATTLVPRALDCLDPDDALKPIAGNPYDYEIVVPVPDAWAATEETWVGLQYHWFVTQDGQFYNAGAFDPDAVTDGTFFNVFEDFATGFSEYNIAYDGANTTNKLRITWHGGGYDPSLPIFVGISVTGTITGGDITACSPNNLKIWKIEPQWAFTLDIDNLNADGTAHTPSDFGDNLDNCISPIIAADYDPSTPDGVIYDFGENVLYYDVIAANWYDRWQLGVRVDNLDANQLVTIDWAYPVYLADDPTTPAIDETEQLNMTGMTWVNIVSDVATAGPHISSTLIAPQATGASSVGQAGENIIIRVTVDHGNLYEGLDDLPLTLVVDGIVAPESSTAGVYVVGDPNEVGDVHWTSDNTTTPATCPWYDSYSTDLGHDFAIQTIKARPTITPVNPGAGTFLPLH
jgi:hypothetical protein